MFYIPFWIFVATSIIASLIAIYVYKLRFIDIQIIMMVIALTMASDMLLCKQFQLYTYVDVNYKGWYSFWANSLITPSFGLVFIKFIPTRKRGIGLYIILWSIGCTLLELYVLKPTGVVHYYGWKPIPHSTIGYIIVLVWECIYFRILGKHLR